MKTYQETRHEVHTVEGHTQVLVFGKILNKKHPERLIGGELLLSIVDNFGAIGYVGDCGKFVASEDGSMVMLIHGTTAVIRKATSENRR